MSTSSILTDVPTPSPGLDLRPAESRFVTQLDWLDSKHSFSFGPHHDPTNTQHGLLLVHNDDIVRAGTGFGMHPHRDMEIVTWVLSGELEHRDSEGNHGAIAPGLAQRMSAGSGIFHSEHNPSATTDVHFLQMWVVPDQRGVNPGYAQLDVSADLATGSWVTVAAGQPGADSAISIHQANATMYAAQLGPDQRVAVPDDRHVHLFVANGAGHLNGRSMSAGDAARLTGADGVEFTTGADGAHVVVWATA